MRARREGIALPQNPGRLRRLSGGPALDPTPNSNSVAVSGQLEPVDAKLATADCLNC